MSGRALLALGFGAMAVIGCTSLLGDDFAVDAVGGSGSGASGSGANNAGKGGANAGANSAGGGMAGGGGVAPAHCSNDARDEGETDVDCGGTCSQGCDLGEGCALNSDCASDNCNDKKLCIPPPPCGGNCASWQTCKNDVCTPGAIVYINLDGGTFSYGADDDASLSIQQVSNEALPATSKAYGGTEFTKAALIAPIVEKFKPFNIQITRTRPDSGTPYQMVVVTPSGSPFAPKIRVWAPSPDCGDQDDNNMAFVIFDANSNTDAGFSSGDQATVVSHAIGIMLGLEPANAVADIMNSGISDGSIRTFENLCHAKPLSSTWVCNTEHKAQCNGNVDLQNSYAELMALFGARP